MPSSAAATASVLIEPLEVLDFHNFLARSLSDSHRQRRHPGGGAFARQAGAGHARHHRAPRGHCRRYAASLVGTEEETIYKNFKELLEDRAAYDKMAHASNPYGDGFASVRIADALCRE